MASKLRKPIIPYATRRVYHKLVSSFISASLGRIKFFLGLENRFGQTINEIKPCYHSYPQLVEPSSLAYLAYLVYLALFNFEILKSLVLEITIFKLGNVLRFPAQNLMKNFILESEYATIDDPCGNLF